MCSSSVPIVVSQVATESLVIGDESLAETTPRKHKASGMRGKSEYMRIAGQQVEMQSSVSAEHASRSGTKRDDVLGAGSQVER